MNEFSSCYWVIAYPTGQELQKAIQSLLTCGHGHRFCVALDTQELYLSTNGLGCTGE